MGSYYRQVTDRRPWGGLGRAQIVDAAMEIARAEGIEALTIRRLATEVGASRMALYRHVPDQDSPRLRALLPELRGLTGDQVFEAELDMVVSAIHQVSAGG
jgi:AcrR family transcriptional regulator